ncbi:MAG: hypothetical protein AAGD96_03380 [Chloroflexota bacterium]
MDQDQLRVTLTWIMVATAAAGTAWYFWIEYSTRGNLENVWWSAIAVVWFVVLRRVAHFWRRG